MTKHHLVMIDRNDDGHHHVHRWAPTCSCGQWAGVFRKRRNDAVALHSLHAQARVNKPNRSWPERQPVTPYEDVFPVVEPEEESHG